MARGKPSAGRSRRRDTRILATHHVIDNMEWARAGGAVLTKPGRFYYAILKLWALRVEWEASGRGNGLIPWEALRVARTAPPLKLPSENRPLTVRVPRWAWEYLSGVADRLLPGPTDPAEALGLKSAGRGNAWAQLRTLRRDAIASSWILHFRAQGLSAKAAQREGAAFVAWQATEAEWTAYLERMRLPARDAARLRAVPPEDRRMGRVQFHEAHRRMRRYLVQEHLDEDDRDLHVLVERLEDLARSRPGGKIQLFRAAPLPAD